MATTLEELQIKFTAEMGGLNTQLNGVKQAVAGIEAPTGKASGALGNLAKMGKIIGGAAIGAKLISVGKEAIAMANDAVESESLFSVSMGSMADSTRAWSEDLSKSLGLNAVEVRKSVGTFNVMFNSMGLGETQARDMSQGMTELAQDMASFYNLDPTEAFQKLSAGITGEAEPLKRLGILIDENTISQYAMKKGISTTGKEMTQQQKILARYGAIMEQTKKAQGDLARTMESPTNQLRRMSAQVDAAKIALGTALQPALLAVLPVLTSLAVGAADVINAFTGMGGNDNPISEIALSLDEARELVKKSVDTSSIELTEKINALDEQVTKALDDYMTAEKAIKKVQIELTLDPPTTTGEWRINDELERLKGLIPVTIDTTPITTKLNAIVEDGEVTEKEERTMSDALNKWSKNAIYLIKIDAKNKTKAIDAEVKAGIITEDKGKTLKAEVQRVADESIAAVNATVGVINVEVGAGAGSLTTVSFTPSQAVELGKLISAQANTHQIAVTAEVNRIEATWAGDGEIGETVTGIYTEVETAFLTKNAELKAIAEKMMSGIATDQMWTDALALKEEIRQMTAFLFEDNTAYGAVFNFDLDLSAIVESSGAMLTALNEYLTLESERTKKSVEQKIGDIMSLPPDIFAKKFPGKTPADVIAEIRADAEAELAADKSAAILALAQSFMPGIIAALQSGTTLGEKGIAIDTAVNVNAFLQSIDVSTLSRDAQAQVLEMLQSLDFMGSMGIENPFQKTIDELIAALKIPEIPTDGKGKEGAEKVTAEIKTETANTQAAASAQSTAAVPPAPATAGIGKTAAATVTAEIKAETINTKTAANNIALAATVPAVDNTAIGENAAGSVATGLNNKLPEVTAAANKVASEIARVMKLKLLIGSPSKVAIGLGSYIGEGLAIGMTDTTRMVSNAASALAMGATNALTGITASTPSLPTPNLSGSESAISRAVEQVMGRLNIELVVDGERLGRASIKAINSVQQRSGRTILSVT